MKESLDKGLKGLSIGSKGLIRRDLIGVGCHARSSSSGAKCSKPSSGGCEARGEENDCGTWFGSVKVGHFRGFQGL